MPGTGRKDAKQATMRHKKNRGADACVAALATQTSIAGRAAPAPEDALRRELLRWFGGVALLTSLPACGGGGGGSSASTAASTSTGGDGSTTSSSSSSSGGGSSANVASTAFVHPGLPHTDADFARMREMVAAGTEPWASGWAALIANGRAQLGAAPRPLETVIRGGTGENFAQMYIDIARTYQLALRWKVSQDTAYADLAVSFLNAWSSTMSTLTGNADRFLAAGIYGYQWACAAEIMRTYPGWAAADVARFQALLRKVFYPLNHQFLTDHNGAVIVNYWANWDLCSIAAMLAIGVFCDDADIYAEAITYYKTGRGCGAGAHNVYFLHPGYLGQWQEAGRDQGHATLGISLTAALCEMAWAQGEDLYGYANNRFLAGAEYVAKSNLTDADGIYYSLPFATYTNNHGTMTAVSTASQPTLRPGWEAVYHHYVNRKGLAAPYVAAMVAKLRPEGDGGNGDQLGFGTLTYSREAIAAGAKPSGLSAVVRAGQVVLSWWGSANASSYKVWRASSTTAPFTLMTSVTDPRTWTDTPTDGTWYYRVTAVFAGGESAPSEVVRVVLPTELRLHLPLDASSAADSSGNALAGSLVGGASWGAGRSGGSALALDGSSGHLALPNDVASTLGDFTIAAWVYWNDAVTNTRVFDFGRSDIVYMSLIPRSSSGVLRFMISHGHYFDEQAINASSALPTGRWVHVAVTLAGQLGTLYIDGAAAGSNAAIELTPFQLGDTTQNWLGRSQYAADPYFNGRIADFRLYNGALSAAAIAALAT